MVFYAFKNVISKIGEVTPNSFLPKLGEKMSKGKIETNAWAELYLLIRFVFSLALATALPKSLALTLVVAIIQATSLIYLLRIVFPLEQRNLTDPSRSLFFALGHYLEIGFSMGYVYWCIGIFNDKAMTIYKCVYFSFITMTTIGYGDIHPDSDVTRLLVTLHAVAGIFMLATVVGLFLSLSTSAQSKTNGS